MVIRDRLEIWTLIGESLRFSFRAIRNQFIARLIPFRTSPHIMIIFSETPNRHTGMKSEWNHVNDDRHPQDLPQSRKSIIKLNWLRSEWPAEQPDFDVIKPNPYVSDCNWKSQMKSNNCQRKKKSSTDNFARFGSRRKKSLKMFFFCWKSEILWRTGERDNTYNYRWFCCERWPRERWPKMTSKKQSTSPRQNRSSTFWTVICFGLLKTGRIINWP